MISEQEFEGYNAIILNENDGTDMIDIDEHEKLKAALKAVKVIPESVIDAIDFSAENMGLSDVGAAVVIKHIWTVTDAGEDMYATGGFHYVDRMGYLVTEKPWDNANDIAEYFIRIHPVSDDDTQDVINYKFQEAVDREMFDYIDTNFIQKGLMIEKIESLSLLVPEIAELLTAHSPSR